MSSNPSSSTSRTTTNALLARQKALYTRVYISGLAGVHTLETGLAYYYRGHYIYAYPAGNLIEPVPYSTRKGIMIQGVVDAGAPSYDAKADGLRSEEEVGALRKSVLTEKLAAESAREGGGGVSAGDGLGVTDSKCLGGVDARKASGSAASLPLRLAPPVDNLQHSLTSLSALRDGGMNAFTPRHGAAFLAASAPGSRIASRSASPSGLRPTSSHAGLTHMGTIRGHSSPSGNKQFEANSVAEDGLSRSGAETEWLVGLGDHALSAEEVRGSRGRVRPCAIHGEECDGVAVGEPWLTEQVRRGRGLVEGLPIVERGGRQMVDWKGLLGEPRA